MLKNSISKADSNDRATRRLTLATNLRFIALILRWGKKTTSYNVFLNALALCKQLVDTSTQKGVISTTEVFDNKKNKIQDLSIKRLSYKHGTTTPMLFEKVYTQKKSPTSLAQRNNFDKNKGGRRDRLQAKFSGLYHNSMNASTSFLDNANRERRLAFPLTEYTSVVQRRLHSRRVNLKTLMVENFTNKTALTPDSTTKQIEFGSTVRAQGQDSSKLPFAILQKKKNITIKNNSGIARFERVTIGLKSMLNVSPSVETRKVRIGGATYAVPYVPHNARQEGLGIRWLIACASAKKQRSNVSWDFCFANVLSDSLKNEGQSIKKRDQSHQTAAANRAYTRYRWW